MDTLTFSVPLTYCTCKEILDNSICNIKKFRYKGIWGNTIWDEESDIRAKFSIKYLTGQSFFGGGDFSVQYKTVNSNG